MWVIKPVIKNIYTDDPIHTGERVVQSAGKVFQVGYYEPDFLTFVVIFEFDSVHEAAAKVHYLNGGNAGMLRAVVEEHERRDW